MKRPLAAYFNERVSDYIVEPGTVVTDGQKKKAPSSITPKNEPSGTENNTEKSPSSPSGKAETPKKPRTKKVKRQSKKTKPDESQLTPKDNTNAEMIESLKALGYISD